MPAIRSQRCPPTLVDGIEIETVEFGKRRVSFLELGGNQVRLTAFLDDMQIATEDLVNPSIPELYTWVANAMFPGEPVSADGKTINVGEGSLYVSWHVVQRNPLDLRLLTSNAPPPASWWQ